MKMRCRRCQAFCYDFVDRRQDDESESYCGMHGRAKVDPDGVQQNLDHRGGCGFVEKKRAKQLTLNF